MSTKRIMVGIADLTGRLVNTLRVGEMTARHPAPRYRTTCEVCGTTRIFAQTAIINGAARCVSDGCGKRPIAPRSTLAATDVAAPAVRSRDSASARQFQAEEDARRKEAEQRHRNADSAERTAAQKRKHREFMREGILTGIDPASITENLNDTESLSPLPDNETNAYLQSEADKFRKACPDYYPCPENFDAIRQYIERNCPDVKRVSARHWAVAYIRLNEFGLLKQRPPAAAPAETARPKPVAVNLTIAKDDGSEQGWDAVTGRPITLTRRQVAALSADEYRIFKRIYADQLNSLPNVGPGPRGLNK